MSASDLQPAGVFHKACYIFVILISLFDSDIYLCPSDAPSAELFGGPQAQASGAKVFRRPAI
jgi:hypothetical protein